MTALAIILAWAGFLGAVELRRWVGVPSTVSLLPHQKGILFRRGLPVKEVGPGKHRVWTGVEKVFLLDARPIPVNFIDRAVTLIDGTVVVYGFSGVAEINETRKVLYSAANYTHVPGFVLLCCARKVLNICTVEQIRRGRGFIESRITDCARQKLGACGFGLQTFRLTQLAIATAQGAAPELSPIF